MEAFPVPLNLRTHGLEDPAFSGPAPPDPAGWSRADRSSADNLPEITENDAHRPVRADWASGQEGVSGEHVQKGKEDCRLVPEDRRQRRGAQAEPRDRG